MWMIPATNGLFVAGIERETSAGITLTWTAPTESTRAEKFEQPVATDVGFHDPNFSIAGVIQIPDRCCPRRSTTPLRRPSNGIARHPAMTRYHHPETVTIADAIRPAVTARLGSDQPLQGLCRSCIVDAGQANGLCQRPAVWVAATVSPVEGPAFQSAV